VGGGKEEQSASASAFPCVGGYFFAVGSLVARRSREGCKKVARELRKVSRGREKVAKTEASRDAKEERAKERRTSERASRISVISE
jgi:hypothetical protein